MKFLFSQNTIIQGLQKAVSIIPSKTGAAFLRAVWIGADNNSVTFFSTDSSVEYSCFYPAKVEEPGIVGVQASILYGLLNSCVGDIEFITHDNENVLYIKHKSGLCKLPTYDVNWFKQPQMIDNNNYLLCNSEIFNDAFERTIFCIPESSSIPSITNLYISKDYNENGKISLVGLDGYKFAMYSFKDDTIYNNLPDEGLLLQKKYAQQLSKFTYNKEFYISYTDKRIFVKTSTEIVSFPRALGNFPDSKLTKNKFNVDYKSRLDFKRSEFMSTLNRISAINSDRESYISIKLNKNYAEFSSFSDSNGEIIEKLEIKYDGKIEKIAFKTKQILDVLEHFSSEDMYAILTTDIGPCMLKCDKDPFYISILMPLNYTSKSTYDYDE
ncbi:MAG: hypothetical protein K5657_03295 [Desulfovibrio sp.]|nr:hypothetical protein [Desulfovibrio sp.]